MISLICLSLARLCIIALAYLPARAHARSSPKKSACCPFFFFFFFFFFASPSRVETDFFIWLSGWCRDLSNTVITRLLHLTLSLWMKFHCGQLVAQKTKKQSTPDSPPPGAYLSYSFFSRSSW
ncbi:hypothetical protein BC940DRAFT_175731 [Gongronella butleri]|nr:hypothetical protein BC940DRAFT_175731 [Gongronella butleri]